ncbi:MAG TPA: hypothetical protein VG013_11375 [Gemmataceae bacterium]|jgi:hypothetical protein|nr:hypothetical protein [Gemmataceae bacterium]
MKQDRFDRLLAFLQRLDKAKIHYTLHNYREDAVSVEVYVPGEHWEVDFLATGEIDVERYRSNGEIEDESMLEELFAKYSDTDTPTEEAANVHEPVARK